MEHRIEKISRPIASEWATRAIRPVSTGSEAQGEDARIGIAKGGNRPAPVFPIHVSAAADARNIGAVAPQPLATIAGNDTSIESFQLGAR
jgi:hypothetical protein